MRLRKGLLALPLLASVAGGYYIFNNVFDTQYPSVRIKSDDQIDSPTDMSRPTHRRLINHMNKCAEEFDKLPFEQLEITSFDGLKLHGDLLRGNPEEVVICVHGYKSSKSRDFADKYEIYRKRGSTVLFVSDRAHQPSEGRYIGFSELDKYDVASWVDKINEMYDNPRIYLHGVSMGGATVIHCANMHLKNLCGIVDDCGFDSIPSIVRAILKEQNHLPYFPIGYSAAVVTKLKSGIDFYNTNGEKCVEESDVPIVFIHGREDHYVPCYMSLRLFGRCRKGKEMLLVEDCGHAAAYMCDPEGYTRVVNKLLDGEVK